VQNEVATCRPFLERQIDLIKPTVIVALGKTAAISLLGLNEETSLASLRGESHSYQGFPVVVTYHPAYLLRKPEDKAKSWRDLCLAQSLHDER
jgi:DNA polymerase